MSQQAVFLFDLNAFSEFKHESDAVMHKFVSCLRVVCLRSLTELSNVSRNFRFGVKFFNQGNFTHEKDKNALFDVSLQAFENFEKKIIERYSRYFAYTKKISQGLKAQDEKTVQDKHLRTSDFPPVGKLNLALTETLCDYEWNSPDICSPVRKKRRNLPENVRKKYIFLFSSCPMDLLTYCGVDKQVTATDLCNLIMSPPLYKKFVVEADINLIWLDTSAISSLESQNNGESALIRETMRNAIEKLKGVVLPLHLFVPADIMTDVVNHRQNAEKQIYKACLLNDIVPFSEIFACYISTPCGRTKLNTSNFQLLLNEMIIKLKGRRIESALLSNQSPIKSRISTIKSTCKAPLDWHEFKVEGLVTRKFCGIPDTLLIYQVIQHRSSSAINEQAMFNSVQKKMLLENVCMVLKCISKDQSIAIGFLHPLTTSIGIIAIYNQMPLHSRNMQLMVNKNKTMSPEKLKENQMEQLISNIVSQGKPEEETCDEITEHLKPFQLASLEKWFVNFSRISEIDQKVSEHRSQKTSGLNSLLQKLQQEYRQDRKRKSVQSPVVSPHRRSTRLKRQKTELIEASTSEVKNAICVETLPVSNQEDNVIDYLRGVYESTLVASGSVLSSAQLIVKSIVQFLNSKKESNITKEDLSSFMDEHFLKSPKRIVEEYDGKTDPESISRRTKEYEIQVLLHMEMETIFPDISSSNNCITNVIALLRRMLFVVGHTGVCQFLCDCLKENYNVSLHHVVEEIEEELGVSVSDSPMSSSSPAQMLSPDTATRSSHGSVPSCCSSSSISSQRNNGSFKRTLSQHSFSASTFNRQIMVPCDLLRKQKDVKLKPNLLALRKSPRLADKGNASPKPAAVRRNLFNSEAAKSNSPSTSASTKSRKRTPKGRHVLKVSYVPETPSPKQGKSSVRVRQAHLRKLSGNCSASVVEVAESPRFSGKKQGNAKESSKDCDTVKTPTLRKTDSKEPQSATLISYYHPSPTTRERCSKRLFQNSPRLLRR